MFENLSEKFQGVLKKLRGHGRISEGNVEGALNEVRLFSRFLALQIKADLEGLLPPVPPS